MAITLRPALPEDFAFCEAIYFTEMDQIMTDLGIDKARHRVTFKAGWRAAEVQVIELEGRDIGWMQTWPEADSLYLSQLFIEAAHQNRGIGAHVLAGLLARTDAGERLKDAVAAVADETGAAKRDLYQAALAARTR